MRYKIIKKDNGKAVFYTLYANNTYAITEVIAGRPLEEMLKDVYILTKNSIRHTVDITPPTDMENYNPNLRATSIIIKDFFNMQGTVYDQFGDVMTNKHISWSVIGSDKVRIEDGKIEEDDVGVATNYSIVAVCEGLEKRQQRTIYPPAMDEDTSTPKPSYEELEEALRILLGGEQ